MAREVTQSSFQSSVLGEAGGSTDDGADISGSVTETQDTEGADEIDQGTEEVDDTTDDSSPDEPASVTYKKDQVEAIVKTRVGTLNRRIEKLSRFKVAVDKLCQVTGLDFEKLAARLDGMTIEQQAQILGTTPDKIRESRMAQEEIARERGKNQGLSRQLEEQTLKADPKFKDFDLFKEEIDELIEENPKLTLKQAYLLVKGDSALTAASRDAEQRAIAKVVNSQKKGVVKPVGGAASTGVKLDAGTISAAKAIGMDPAEYAAYSRIDNLDAYRAAKKKG